MLYEIDLTIPANTPASSPAFVEEPLAPCNINQVEVMIPEGHRGLTRTRLLVNGHQVWPSNPDASLKGENDRIRWREDYDLDESPFTVRIEGWSPGTTFNHTITWRIAALPIALAEQARSAPGLLGRLADFVGVR